MRSDGRTSEAFDYIIVGAGSAGCVLADRLSEDGRSTVCVLEAGPPDNNLFLHVPAGFIKILFNPRYTWQFKTSRSGFGGAPHTHHAGAHSRWFEFNQRIELYAWLALGF